MNGVDLNNDVLHILELLQENGNIRISDNCNAIIDAIGCVADSNTQVFEDEEKLTTISSLYWMYRDFQNLKSKK